MDMFISVRSTLQTHFGTPVSLGSAVNDEATETYATLLADGTMLLFTSDRPGGLGNSDLWMTRRVLKSGSASPASP